MAHQRLRGLPRLRRLALQVAAKALQAHDAGRDDHRRDENVEQLVVFT